MGIHSTKHHGLGIVCTPLLQQGMQGYEVMRGYFMEINVLRQSPRAQVLNNVNWHTLKSDRRYVSYGW